MLPFIVSEEVWLLQLAVRSWDTSDDVRYLPLAIGTILTLIRIQVISNAFLGSIDLRRLGGVDCIKEVRCFYFKC